MPDKIYYGSIDGDECLFHWDYRANYTAQLHDQWVIKHNTILLNYIFKKIYHQKIKICKIGVGSARQSPEIDFANSLQLFPGKGFHFTDSVFNAVNTIVEFLQGALAKNKHIMECVLSLDDYLGTDTTNQEMPGTSFKRGLDLKHKLRELQAKILSDFKGKNFRDPIIQDEISTAYNEGIREHCGALPSWVPFDQSKLTILYAQMHKLASENPEAEILFEFFDDREDILDNLEFFFKANSDLIPKNVTLQLTQYEHDILPPFQPKIAPREAIASSSDTIDFFYNQSVRKIVDLCVDGAEEIIEINAIEFFNLNPGKLAEFKTDRLSRLAAGLQQPSAATEKAELSEPNAPALAFQAS